MKVTAIIGSARKKNTHDAVEKVLHTLQSYGDVQHEIIMLSDYDLKICRGCKLCLDKGETLCPLKDDRDILIQKIESSDGVIFASPNYSFHVSGHMKVFLDRLGYIFHRPRFFGKAFTSIVAQGIYGGKDILKYFNFIGKGLGFNRVKGVCITTREPISEKDQKKNDKKLNSVSKNFYNQLLRKKLPAPSFFELMFFRISRTSMKFLLDDNYRDYTYYSKTGWFESDYYFSVKLNPFKKLFGKIVDAITMRMVKS